MTDLIKKLIATQGPLLVEARQEAWDAYCGRFLDAQDVSASSKKTYRKALRSLKDYLCDRQIQAPVREDILQYKDHLASSGLRPFTISTYMTGVRQLFEWVEITGLGKNIAKGIKGMKRPKGFMKDALTKAQIGLVLSRIDRSSLAGLRDYALINLLIRTGLRCIEASRINIGDMRQESGKPVLQIWGKGCSGKDDYVVLEDSAQQPIMEYISALKAVDSKKQPTQDEDAPLFVSLSNLSNGERLHVDSISRVVKKRFKAVGLDSRRLTAHSTRHTSITLALEAGASIQEAQQMARHSSVNTTMIYSHNINRLKSSAESRISDILPPVEQELCGEPAYSG